MTAPKLADQLAAKLDASPKVVTDWRRFFHWRSVQIPAFGTILLAIGPASAYAFGAVALRDLLPMYWVSCIAIVVFLATMVGRLIHQTPAEPDDDDTNHA